MGEVRDRAMAIAMLVEAFAVKDVTPARVLAYENGLKDVATPLLNAAVRRAIATRTFFPKVAELRTDAEMCRRELLAANTYSPCAQCDETGWEPVLIDGVQRLARCGCWRRYQAKLAQLGVGQEALALPPGDREFVND
jgi:hypothetical protein